ncbi:MAG TPA: TonB family protein [Solimonas sp.]|nr:TonB family protein [Solimonas sp.]
MTGWRLRAGLALLVALLAHACLALGWWLQAWGPPRAELQLPAGPGEGLELGLAPAPPDAGAAVETRPLPLAQANAERQLDLDTHEAASAAAIRESSSGAPEPGGGGNSSSYFTRVRMHLSRFRNAGAPAPAGSGVTDLRFEVASDGSVRDLQVLHSGGAPERDAAALALVRRAAPLPRPPAGQATRLVVPIEFR